MLCVEVWGNSLPAKASPRPREQGAVISVTKAARPKFYSLCWLYGIRYMSIFSISVLGRSGIQFTAAATTGCRRDIYPNSASRLTNTRVVLNDHALKQNVVTAQKGRLFCRRPVRALHSSHSIVRTVLSFTLPTCCTGLP